MMSVLINNHINIIYNKNVNHHESSSGWTMNVKNELFVATISLFKCVDINIYIFFFIIIKSIQFYICICIYENTIYSCFDTLFPLNYRI